MNGSDNEITASHVFGRWRFDVHTGDLFDGESTTRLEPQVAKLLAYFLDHQNTLTSRDELMAEVWQNRIVTDDAINRCVSILRQLLSPDDKNAYIETVVRRGFISHFPDAPSPPVPSEQTTGRKLLLILGGVVGVAAMILLITRVTQQDPPPTTPDVSPDRPPMVAVLPFMSLGLEGDNAYFARGVHDDLLTQLAQLQAIRVISRTSVLEYQDSQKNIRDIGKELGADAILEGSIQSVGDDIRINMQLIDAATDEHLWARSYQRELSPANLFAVQSEIARAIAGEMHTNLTEQDASQLAVLPTENMAAYRAYHQALKIRDTSGVEDPAYLEAFERAVTLDPAFVRAWAELAGYLSFQSFQAPDPGTVERVEQILELIQAQAPDSADLLIAQTYYAYYILKDYEQAHKLASLAHEMRPSDARVLELRSWIERRLGDPEARGESIRMARTLDPRNPLWTSIIVRNLMIMHRYDEASDELDKVRFQSFELAGLQTLLQLREHGDLQRWGMEFLALKSEYEGVAKPHDFWSAYIALRDFSAAEASLTGPKGLPIPGIAAIIEGYPFGALQLAVTQWLVQRSERPDDPDLDWSGTLEELLAESTRLDTNQAQLIEALQAGARGDPAEAERLVRRWRRMIAGDLAEQGQLIHFSCRVLGLTGAIEATVECIRNSLVEPSYVMPFYEPFLPYYDQIRVEPEFVELLAEID